MAKPQILVYLIGSIGDTIVAIPALRVVRREFPDHEIILLHNTASGTIVDASQVVPDDLVDGYLSYTVHVHKWRRAKEFFRLYLELSRREIAAAIYLPYSLRAAGAVRRDKMFFRLCGIRRTIGFHAFTKDELFPVNAEGRPAAVENEAVFKLRRLARDGVEILPAEDLKMPLLAFRPPELQNARRWLDERRRKPARRLVAIAPGCKTLANVWSIANFIELGKKLIAAEDCELLVVGGTSERETGEQMIRAWGEGINAAGEFSVFESGAVLSLCDSYIGLDTGTTHLAAAAGVRCLAIYGERNNPGRWFPLGDNHRIVQHPVECAGCLHFVCPVENHPCMTGVTVDKVWQAWLELDGDNKNQLSSKLSAAVSI